MTYTEEVEIRMYKRTTKMANESSYTTFISHLFTKGENLSSGLLIQEWQLFKRKRSTLQGRELAPEEQILSFKS